MNNNNTMPHTILDVNTGKSIMNFTYNKKDGQDLEFIE